MHAHRHAQYYNKYIKRARTARIVRYLRRNTADDATLASLALCSRYFATNRTATHVENCSLEGASTFEFMSTHVYMYEVLRGVNIINIQNVSNTARLRLN